MHGNKLKVFVVHLKNMADNVSEYVPEEKVIGAAGETTNVHLQLRAMVKSVAAILDLIVSQQEAYYANIEECKKIETDVAACTPLVAYRTQTGVKKAYWVVKGVERVHPASSDLVNSRLILAASSYANKQYPQAYQHICDAYQQICVSGCS